MTTSNDEQKPPRIKQTISKTLHEKTTISIHVLIFTYMVGHEKAPYKAGQVDASSSVVPCEAWMAYAVKEACIVLRVAYSCQVDCMVARDRRNAVGA